MLRCDIVADGVKICFVNALYSHRDNRGGLGSHIADLSFELARSGHEVTVITSGSEHPYTEHGVSVIPTGKVTRYSSPWQLLNPSFLLRRLSYMARMTWHVLRARYDIVEAADGGFEHLALVLFTQCPVVTKLHGNFRHIYSNGGAILRLMERLEAFAVRRSHGIYTSSLTYAQTIASDYKIPLERIQVIPQAIGFSVPANLGAHELQDKYPAIQSKKLVFLGAGSSPIRKGALVFVEAAEQLADNEGLVFVLSCGPTHFLKGKRLPANLLMLPILNRDEFLRWVCESDLVVFPSYFESFSIAVREAMFLNKTIIVSRFIPLEDMDCDYPRYSVLHEIAATPLANAIREAITGDKGGGCSEIDRTFHRRLVEKYAIGRVAQITVDLYRTLTE
jgi:glycosyltransferase involved in cell wall biosynthesis